MRVERFEYFNKDIPMLRKDLFFRLIFMIGFLSIFAWQFVLFVINFNRQSLTIAKTIVTICLMVSTLLFALISFSYVFRNFNTIQKVVLHGHMVRNITIISTGRKNSFLKIYSILTTFISLCMLVVLCCALTYNILQYVYYTTFSYYLPLLLFVAVAGFNSVYHIRQEIKTIQNVSTFNSIF